MSKKSIIITGAAGFIASVLTQHLSRKEKDVPLVLVDNFSRNHGFTYNASLTNATQIDRNEFLPWLLKNAKTVKQIYHLGARTDTACNNWNTLQILNLNYSKTIWEIATKYEIPLVYASSAATYGDGSLGFDDNHEVISKLVPLNLYGKSKNDFDLWTNKQNETPPTWKGLKFFNVYGPNEFHKGRMASVIFHAYNQIKKTGKMKLFRSHNPDYKDGEQSRDFIYVEDVVACCSHLMNSNAESGLYNIGTGKARSFYDLAAGVFHALGLEPDISFIDTPIDIRDKYQYYTRANTQKLIDSGYNKGFTSLENGITQYVNKYLIDTCYF